MMKRFTLLVLATILTTLTFGQREIDFKVELMSPGYGYNIVKGEALEISFKITNLSSEKFTTSDTIIFQPFLGTTPITQNPLAAKVQSDLGQGMSISLNINFDNGLSFTNEVDEIDLCVLASPYNRYNPVSDPDNNNNSGCETVNLRLTASDLDIVAIENVKLYPNPVSNNLNLEYYISSESETSVKLFDLNGKVVYSNIFNDQSGVKQQSIDVSQMANGVYILEITVQNKVIREKVIISR